MLGTIDPKHRDATVVGAGIAGLLAADALDRGGFAVTLLEAAPRAGGLIRTEPTPYGIAEYAAHSVLATAPVLELCRRLGVDLVGVRPERGSKSRYIYRQGRLRRFPLNPLEAMQAFTRAYFVLADRKADPARLTLEDWGRRHFGPAVVRQLLSPMVLGIYGARPSEIAVGAAFPGLVVPHGHSFLSALLHKVRSRARTRSDRGSRTRSKMMTAAAGMGGLVAALAADLERRLGSRFIIGRRVEGLPDSKNLVLAVPAPEAARLLVAQAPALAQSLARLSYTPLVAATAFVPRSAVPVRVRGVGVLVPEAEGRECLGILFNSSAFPARVEDESQWVSFTVMLGGSGRPGILKLDDGAIRAIVDRELRDILGVSASPSHVEISRQPGAVPRYGIELMELWEQARETWCAQPGRVLFANYTGQVSIRGMIEAAARIVP